MSEAAKWTERIITFAIGGGLAGLGTFVLQKRKADVEDFTILKEAYREEFKRYEEKFDKLLAQYAKLEAKYEHQEEINQELKASISTIKSSYPDLPIPMWLKDHNGVMLSLNKAYEDAFLFPQGMTRLDYLGKHDDDVWGEEIAEVFRQNDLRAISQKKMSFVIEDDLDSDVLKGWQFFKYPKYVDGIFVGVGGLALPETEKSIKQVL